MAIKLKKQRIDVKIQEEAKKIAKAIVGLDSYRLEDLMETFSGEIGISSYVSGPLHDAILHSMEELHQHDVNGQLNPVYIKLLDEEYMPIIEKAEDAVLAQMEFEGLDYSYDQSPDSEEKGIELQQAKKQAKRLNEEFQIMDFDEVVEATKAVNEQLEDTTKKRELATKTAINLNFDTQQNQLQNAMRKHSLIKYSVIEYTFDEVFKKFDRYDYFNEIPFEDFYCDQEASRIDACSWSDDWSNLTYNDLVFPVIYRGDYTHHPSRSYNSYFKEFIHEVYIPDLDLPGKEEFIKKAQEQFGASKVHVYKPEDRINRAEDDKIIDDALKYKDNLTEKQCQVENEVQNFIEDFMATNIISELNVNPISINGHLYDIIKKEDTEQAGKMIVLTSTSNTNDSLKLNEREFFILFVDEMEFLNLDELQSFNQEILKMRARLRNVIQMEGKFDEEPKVSTTKQVKNHNGITR